MRLYTLAPMDFSGPDAIDNAIKAGLDIDGSPLPDAMLRLYREVMDQEAQRKRSGEQRTRIYLAQLTAEGGQDASLGHSLRTGLC